VGGAQLQLPGDGGQVVPRDAQLRGGRGRVVGHQVVGGRQRAAVWGHTGMTLLAPAWGFDTTASGIAGRVVGVTYALDDEPVVSCSAAALHVDGTVVPLDPAADSSTVQDVTSFGIAVGTRTADGCGAGEGVVWIYGTPVPLRSLVGMPQDLQAAEVTEQLYFYGGGFLIRPA
jgi:hypothetical protein